MASVFDGMCLLFDDIQCLVGNGNQFKQLMVARGVPLGAADGKGDLRARFFMHKIVGACAVIVLGRFVGQDQEFVPAVPVAASPGKQVCP